MMNNGDDKLDPAVALGLVRRSHVAAAVRAKAPWWFYPVSGAMFGLQIASFQFSSPWLSLLGLIGGLGAMVYVQNVSGVRLNGSLAGSLRARLIWLSGPVGMVLAAAAALWFERQPGSESTITAVAVAVAMFIAVWGPVWERVFRRDESARA